MKSFSSELYGVIPMPASFRELIRLITDIDYQKPYPEGFVPVRLWRGQANLNWPIDSAGFRRIKHDYSNAYSNNELKLRSYESRLLEIATHRGFRYHEGRSLSDMELLAKLQHHGAATRLVDFSKSSIVALWFAINQLDKKTGLLVGLHSFYLGGIESQIENTDYINLMKEIEHLKHPIVWESPDVSPRIAAQHAEFLYSPFSTAKSGSLWLPEKESNSLFIAISPKLKAEAKEVLSNVFDISTRTLFPDLDGFGLATR